MGELWVREGLGDPEKGDCYLHLHVHKQPFKFSLFGAWGGLGIRGEWGTKRRGIATFMYISNHLGFIFLGDMRGTWVWGGNWGPNDKRMSDASTALLLDTVLFLSAWPCKMNGKGLHRATPPLVLRARPPFSRLY